MGRSRRLPWAAALAGITLLAGGVATATGQENILVQPGQGGLKGVLQPVRRRIQPDFTKMKVIERPLQGIVRQTAPVAATLPNLKLPPRLDIGKSLVIERPLVALVKKASVPAPAVAPTNAFINPKVQPGKVRWHATLEAAQAAAGKSRKPILLFQMMGKLDDQFC